MPDQAEVGARDLTMYIIIDSTELCADFHMVGRNFRVLLDYLAQTADPLCLPQVVIDEVSNKYAETLQASRRKIGKEIEELRRVTSGRLKGLGEPPGLAEADLLEASKTYRSELLARIEAAEGKVLPYPDVPHERLTKRALARKKPFADSGAGYKDALIWESLMELASQGDERIVLVSRNRRDFGDNKGDLHPDLASYLQEQGIDPRRISLVEGLQSFVEQFVTPALEQLQQVAAQMGTGTYLGLDLAELIAVRGPELLGGQELNPADIGFPPEYENPTISLLEDVKVETVKDVRGLSSGELLVELTVSTSCEFDFFIFKSDWYALDEEDEPYIFDSDWNNHYMAASKSRQVEMDLTLTLDPSSKTVTSMDLESIESVWDGA